MKLVLGIGNIGKSYEKTRHNIGFDCIDNFCLVNNINNPKEKFGAIYYETSIKGEKLYLLKPQKYVNLSGSVLKKFVDYYDIDVNDILVIVDDLDLTVGKYKLKPKGSSGGHNGLKDIETNLKTTEYKRLKIGISNDKSKDTRDYVLGRFNKEERKSVNEIIRLSNDIIMDFLEIDFQKLMSKYNK